jgi:hypothetical protein
VINGPVLSPLTTFTDDDAMKMVNVKHNGNLLIKSVYLAHIVAYYSQSPNCLFGACLTIDDHPGEALGYIETRMR